MRLLKWADKTGEGKTVVKYSAVSQLISLKIHIVSSLFLQVFFYLPQSHFFVSYGEPKERSHGPCFQKITWSRLRATLLCIFTYRTLGWRSRRERGSLGISTSIWRWLGLSRVFPGRLWLGRAEIPSARDRAQWKPRTGHEHDVFPNSDFTFPNHALLVSRPLVFMEWWGQGERLCSSLHSHCPS